MKYGVLLAIAILLVVAGCDYEAPLTEEHGIAIDPTVLGLWEQIPDEDGDDADQRMIVLRYSDTEYLIHYPTGEDGMYFRGYPISIGGVSCVQVEFIGTHAGPLDTDEKNLFHVLSYGLENGVLTVMTLNTDLVDDDLTDSEALTQAFVEHAADDGLFTDPGRFKRLKKQD